MKMNRFLRMGAVGSLLCLGWTAIGCGGPETDLSAPAAIDINDSDDVPTAGEERPGETPAPTPEPPSEETGGGPAPEAPVEPPPTPPAEPTVPPSPPAEPTVPPSPPAEPPAPEQPAPGARLDADGVVMLHPAAPTGSSWSLGTRDPNTVDRTYFDLGGDRAARGTENGVTFWTTSGHKVSYASGAPDGVTVRLNIKASGGSQRYTWKNGALQNGFLGNAKDLKNIEATAYVRVRDSNRTHTSMTWKLRGGKHSSSDASLSSCVGMEVPYGGEAPSAAREFDHPKYDYVNLKPKFGYQLQEGQWLGVKVVSYVVPGGTKNFLYLDTAPFDTSGRPRNDFRLFTEWEDRDGKSTGRYSTAATWGGWVTTFRVDGWRKVDFAILSAREIVPPAN